MAEDTINPDVSERRGLYSPPEETPDQRKSREEAYAMLADHLNAVDSASPVVVERPDSPGTRRGCQSFSSWHLALLSGLLAI